MKLLHAAGLCAAAVLGAAFGGPAFAADTKPPPKCFFPTEWDGGWKATPDSKSIYIGVGIHRVYRLDLASECPELNAPESRLITKMRGSSAICDALDIDLYVGDSNGFKSPCIVKTITPLTDDEAKALPKSLRP